MKTSTKVGIALVTILGLGYVLSRRPNPPYVPKTYTKTWQVAASFDDCEVYYYLGRWYQNLSYGLNRVGRAGANDVKYGGGMRFINFDIPMGGIVESSFLTVRCGLANSSTNAPINSIIVGGTEDDPAAFSTIADYQARRGVDAGGANNDKRTIAEIPWPITEAWVTDRDYVSPDITPIIREMVNSPTRNPGGAVVLFWDDHRGTTLTPYAMRMPYSYNGQPAGAARLTVTWRQ